MWIQGDTFQAIQGYPFCKLELSFPTFKISGKIPLDIDSFKWEANSGLIIWDDLLIIFLVYHLHYYFLGYEFVQIFHKVHSERYMLDILDCFRNDVKGWIPSMFIIQW